MEKFAKILRTVNIPRTGSDQTDLLDQWQYAVTLSQLNDFWSTVLPSLSNIVYLFIFHFSKKKQVILKYL